MLGIIRYQYETVTNCRCTNSFWSGLAVVGCINLIFPLIFLRKTTLVAADCVSVKSMQYTLYPMFILKIAS